MTSQTTKQNTDPKVVNVQTVLNENPFSGYQWVIFALCFLIVLLDGFDTAAIGFIAPSLLNEWSIDKSHLGPVLSAALFGLAFGALSAGPLADRIGRKTVLIIAAVVMGGASITSGLVHDLQGLTIWRFITGLGLGAAMPNAITLMNEYCPDKKRSFITNCMFCGFPIGSALGGFIAAWMIPHFGLAQPADCGRCGALDSGRHHGGDAARVGALHGAQELLGRSRAQDHGAHCRQHSQRHELCAGR